MERPGSGDSLRGCPLSAHRRVGRLDLNMAQMVSGRTVLCTREAKK